MAESPGGLNNSKLADTDARTSPSISIYVMPGGTGSQYLRIGAIKSIQKTITRDVTRRFELDADTPGKTVELIPGKVGQISLTITRAMLYTSSVTEAFGQFDSAGSGVEDLVDQNIPFDIEERRHIPGNAGGVHQIVTYKNCYFTSTPMKVDIEGDWQVIQDAEVMVGWISMTNASDVTLTTVQAGTTGGANA